MEILDGKYQIEQLLGQGMSGRSALYQLLNVFVTPVTAIMASLLYLNTRSAGGESLREFIRENLPAKRA